MYSISSNFARGSVSAVYRPQGQTRCNLTDQKISHISRSFHSSRMLIANPTISKKELREKCDLNSKKESCARDSREGWCSICDRISSPYDALALEDRIKKIEPRKTLSKDKKWDSIFY